MLQSVNLRATGHRLRARTRLLGHDREHALAVDDAIEVIPLARGGERKTLRGLRTRAAGGERLLGGTVLVPLKDGWGALRPVDGDTRARTLPVSEADYPLARTHVDGRSCLVFGRPGALLVVDEVTGGTLRTLSSGARSHAVDDAGVVFTFERRELVARALSTSEVVWRATPFGGEKTDAPSAPIVVGDEVHVRAGVAGPSGNAAAIARIRRGTGEILARRTGPALDAWLPDLPPAIEATLARIDARIVHAERDLVFSAVGDGSQGVILRVSAPESTLRVGFAPELATPHHLVGTLHARDTWLVAVPIAELPLGDATCAFTVEAAEGPSVVGEEARVVMALTAVPFFIAQHPVHGRINVPVREDRGRPVKDEVVLLEEVKARPGGVIAVEGYQRRTGTAPAASESFDVPAPTGELPAKHVAASAVSIAPELLLRASEAGVALSSELLAIVRAAEADATFREALVSLGFAFELPARYTEIEAIRAALPGAFPLWSNEYGETLGFLRDGLLHQTWLELPIRPRALGPSFGAAIRAAIADRRGDDDDDDATWAFVEAALDRVSSSAS